MQKTFDSLNDAIFILNAEKPPKIINCNSYLILFKADMIKMLLRLCRLKYNIRLHYCQAKRRGNMSWILRKFGKNVRYYRKKKKLSQEKLAELANLHRTYIGQIEGGNRNVALKNMAKLAKALGVSIKDLV